jgi:hypothetical protein
MAISQRPNRDKATNAQVMAFVDRGGTAPAKQEGRDGDKPPQHPLKFPKGDLFDRLERCRKASTVKLPRNTWILQAIAEKLDRDEKDIR